MPGNNRFAALLMGAISALALAPEARGQDGTEGCPPDALNGVFNMKVATQQGKVSGINLVYGLADAVFTP